MSGLAWSHALPAGNRVVGRPDGMKTRGRRCSEVMNDGASRRASGRADEWGGEADKLGHTDVPFLGNAVKTLEECSWVAARAHNWGRTADLTAPPPYALFKCFPFISSP